MSLDMKIALVMKESDNCTGKGFMQITKNAGGKKGLGKEWGIGRSLILEVVYQNMDKRE